MIVSIVLPWRNRRAVRFGALVACALSAATAFAQPAPVAAPNRGIEPKAERITHEDAGSRVEELRVGGQTRTIEVQTPTGMPSYQVQPIQPSAGAQGRDTEGRHSWRLLRF